MSRAQIITLSVVSCVVAALALEGPASVQAVAYAFNFVLVIVCFVAAGLDLSRRGWELGYLFAASYLVPFIGLIVYVALCNRPVQEPATMPSSVDLTRHDDAVLPPAYPSDEEVSSPRQPSASPRLLFGGVDSVRAQPLS
jgi:hypothetical protein